jgi:hypothetical protein
MRKIHPKIGSGAEAGRKEERGPLLRASKQDWRMRNPPVLRYTWSIMLATLAWSYAAYLPANNPEPVSIIPLRFFPGYDFE